MTFTFMSFESLCYRLDALEMQLQRVGSILVAFTTLTRLANKLGTEEQDFCLVDPPSTTFPDYKNQVKEGYRTNCTSHSFSTNRIWEFNFMVEITSDNRFIRNKIACSFFSSSYLLHLITESVENKRQETIFHGFLASPHVFWVEALSGVSSSVVLSGRAYCWVWDLVSLSLELLKCSRRLLLLL